MINNIIYVVTFVLNNVILSHQNDYGFLSSCDILPRGGEWCDNYGYEVSSWISSIVPFPVKNSKGIIQVGFTSDDYHVRAYEIISSNNIQWNAFGDGKTDGWLYRMKNNKKQHRRDEAYYIYPDFKTALMGIYKDDKFISIAETVVTQYRCNKGLIELKFAEPEPNSKVYLDGIHSSGEYISTKRDPLEKRNVYIGISQMFKNFPDQDGLFAKRNIPAYHLVAYYSGAIHNCSDNAYLTLNEQDRTRQHVISLNDTHCINSSSNMMSDMKNQFTLGHKANQHIQGNAIYTYTKHPILGQIRSLESTRLIEKGEEILIQL